MPFVVIPDTPSVRVTITDETLREVAYGMGTIETTVAPGLYRIEQRFAGAVAVRFVEVGHQAFTARLPLPRVPAPAPVRRTATTHDEHRAAAQRWSGEPTRGDGAPSLMVLLRNLRRGWRLDPYALQITGAGGEAVDGGESGWRVDEEQGWSAWSGDLPPGGYRLRLRRPSGEGLPLAQALWVSRGWTTLVFVSNGPRGAQPQHASVEMAPHGTGWSPADEELSLAREAALSGLRQGIDLISDQLLPMLDSRRADPVLGIVGAHAMLLDHRPDLERVAEVVRRLAPQVPDHPDLAALRTLLGGPPAHVASPPMLAASCRLLIAADADDPGVIEDGLRGGGRRRVPGRARRVDDVAGAGAPARAAHRPRRPRGAPRGRAGRAPAGRRRGQPRAGLRPGDREPGGPGRRGRAARGAPGRAVPPHGPSAQAGGAGHRGAARRLRARRARGSPGGRGAEPRGGWLSPFARCWPSSVGAAVR
ncbi:hypothetical protein RB200_22375 [Streptomyces sp. PmtG]